MSAVERLDPWSELALAAAQAATAAIDQVVAAGMPAAEAKSAGHDLVTTADRAAEAAALAVLRAARPDDAVLGEESGSASGSTGVRWLVDPLDGTANFVHGRPDFAVSVGCEIDGRIAAGAVVRPATGEWAAAGAGILRYGIGDAAGAGSVDRARAQRTPDALVTVGMPYDLAERRRVLRLLGEIVARVQAFRLMGSAAADLLAVARGRADAFVGFQLAAWDTAAGRALVEASGGVFTDLRLDGLAVVVAGSPPVVHELVHLLQEAASA